MNGVWEEEQAFLSFLGACPTQERPDFSRTRTFLLVIL